jgi:hypothetical protein
MEAVTAGADLTSSAGGVQVLEAGQLGPLALTNSAHTILGLAQLLTTVKANNLQKIAPIKPIQPFE